MIELYTKEQLEEIVLWYANEYSDGDCPHTTIEWCKENIKCVDTGDDIVEHKTVYNSDVYRVEGVYFEVTFTRDNSGYWSDGERYDPTICQVVPREVTKIEWVPV